MENTENKTKIMKTMHRDGIALKIDVCNELWLFECVDFKDKMAQTLSELCVQGKKEATNKQI